MCPFYTHHFWPVLGQKTQANLWVGILQVSCLDNKSFKMILSFFIVFYKHLSEWDSKSKYNIGRTIWVAFAL